MKSTQTLTITIEWCMSTQDGNKEVPSEYKDVLEERGFDHAKEKIACGFLMGDMQEELNVDDTPEGVIEFKGTWSIVEDSPIV